MVGVALLGAGTAVAAPNLIVNGSFETPNVPAGTFGIFPAIPGWSHQARAGTTSSGIEIQDHVSGAPAAGAGDQFVEVDSNGPSRIFQDVATSPGSRYRLTFLYSARPGTAASENHFQVSAGPSSLEIGPLASAAQTSWTSAALDFVATASTSRVEYLDLSPEQGSGGLGAYIDLVAVVLTNSPPVCNGVAPSRTSLWPPNHKLRTITLSGASDPDGDPVTISITAVTQDEPVNGKADGNTSPDAVLGPRGDHVRLRAERSGHGDGRVYRIAFTASDPSGARCSGTVTVSVPHDRRGAPAVDSGSTYDSLAGSPRAAHGRGKTHGRGCQAVHGRGRSRSKHRKRGGPRRATWADAATLKSGRHDGSTEAHRRSRRCSCREMPSAARARRPSPPFSSAVG